MPVSAPGVLPTAAPTPAPISANAAPATATISDRPAAAVPRRRRLHRDQQQPPRARPPPRRSPRPSAPPPAAFAAITRPRRGSSRNVVCMEPWLHSPAVDSTPERDEHQRGEQARHDERAEHVVERLARRPGRDRDRRRRQQRARRRPAPARTGWTATCASPGRRPRAVTDRSGERWARTGTGVATAAVMRRTSRERVAAQAAVREKKTSSRPRCSGRRSVSTCPPAAATAPTSDGRGAGHDQRAVVPGRDGEAARPPGPTPAPAGSVERTETPSEPSSDGDRPVGDDPPGADHQQPVDRVLDLAEQVRGQQHRAAAGRVAAEQAAHPADALRVQPVGRLVEHQHRRVGQQRAGDAQPLPHAQRVAADPPSAPRRRARPARAPRRPATPGRRSCRPAAAGASARSGRGARRRRRAACP